MRRIYYFILKNIFLLTIFFGMSAFFNVNADNSTFDQTYDSLKIDFLFRFFEYSDFSYSDNDKQEIEKLYKLSTVKNNPVNKAKVQYLDAFISFCDPVPNEDRLILLIDEALAVLTKDKYPNEYAKLILLKGNIYVDLTNQYIDAYHCIQEALKLFHPEKDQAFIALAYNYLAMIWINLGDGNTALDYINKAEDLFIKAGYIRTARYARTNSYSIRIRLGHFEEISPSIKESLATAQLGNDTTTLIFLNILLGNNYSMMKDYENAEKNLNRAYTLIKDYSPTPLSRKADINYSLGSLYYHTNQYSKSISFFREVQQMIEPLGYNYYKTNIYSMLSDIYYSYGESDSAYYYLKKSVNLRDSVAITEKANELKAAKNRAELMNYQQQLQINEQKSQIKQTRSALTIVLLLFVLAIILFVLYYLNKDKQLKELKITQLDQELKNKEINSRLEKMELEKQMEEKEREIATTHLLMEEKGRVLELLLKTFKPLYEEKEISPKAWKQIETFVTNNSRKENEWEKSKFHFDKVHPDFFKKLKEVAPDLTENELRLSAYIKIGMRTKQIAEMLSIDQRSVITNRYHLKKKLDLPKEQNLDQFIRDI